MLILIGQNEPCCESAPFSCSRTLREENTQTLKGKKRRATVFYWIRKTRICVSLDYREDEVLEGTKIEGVGGLKRLWDVWKNEVEVHGLN